MYTIGQWLSKKNNQKQLKTIHNSHIQLYLCHFPYPSKTGTISSRPTTWVVWCFSLDLGTYLFLRENGPGIPVFGYCPPKKYLVKRTRHVSRLCMRCDWLYVEPILFFWSHLPPSHRISANSQVPNSVMHSLLVSRIS